MAVSHEGGPYVNHCLPTPSSFVGISSFDLFVLNNPPALIFAVHKLRSIRTYELVCVCSLFIENSFSQKCSDQGFFPLFHLLQMFPTSTSILLITPILSLPLGNKQANKHKLTKQNKTKT